MSPNVAAPAASTTITFSEYPVGTAVSSQYANVGIVFAGPSTGPQITTDGANPTSPVLEGGPGFRGDIRGSFVVPGTSQPAAVDSFSLDVGYIDNPGSTQLYVFGAGGKLLGAIRANAYGIVHMTSNFAGATSFLMHSEFSDGAGWAIDNVSFPTPYAAPGAPAPAVGIGGGMAARDNPTCNTPQPVNCASGNFWHTFTDLSIPGRGPVLELTRTYNAQLADRESMFGPGWHSSYDMALISHADGSATVRFPDGSQVDAQPDPITGGYSVPAWADSTLRPDASGGWTFTRRFTGLTYTFDSAGRLVAEQDRNGETTTLTYDAAGALVTVIDPAGRALTFTHNPDGTVASVTDPAGQATDYGYDATGELTKVTDPAGNTWRYGYAADGSHLMTSMIDPRGDTLTNTYDAQGRVSSQTDYAGRTTTFAYTGDAFSAAGGTTTITDPRGVVSVEQYASGMLQAVTRDQGTPAQATWPYAYDPATFAVTAVTDPDGHTTTTVYNQDGDPIRVTDPLGRTTKAVFNGMDEPTSVTDPAGITTSLSYDAAGNLTAVSRPLTSTWQARVTRYQHTDTAHPGDVTAMVDPDGNTWTYSYDADGNPTAVTDPSGDVTKSAYDVLGRRTSTTSPADNTTQFAYDLAGNLVKTTDPAGGVTRFGYDANQNRVSVTDPNGNTTTTKFDADNEPTEITRADGSRLTYSYDQAGNQIGQTNAAGHTTSYTYDALNRVVSVTDPLGRAT